MKHVINQDVRGLPLQAGWAQFPGCQLADSSKTGVILPMLDMVGNDAD